CYRAAHGLAAEHALAEARGLAAVLRSVGAARVVRGQLALGEADWKRLSEEAKRLEGFGKGRQLWVLAPMAGLGPLIDQRQTQAALLRYLDTFDPYQQGSLLNLHQVLALDSLGESAAGRPLEPEVFSKLIRLSQRFEDRVLGVPEFGRFLLRVAPRQPLPPDVRDLLWGFVRAAADPLDSTRLIALRIL